MKLPDLFQKEKWTLSIAGSLLIVLLMFGVPYVTTRVTIVSVPGERPRVFRVDPAVAVSTQNALLYSVISIAALCGAGIMGNTLVSRAALQRQKTEEVMAGADTVRVDAEVKA
jgi:hypothetical protein